MIAQRLSPPVISVVIVNYKVPFYLHQTLRSLRHAALYDQSEIIVVDNASRDDSREVVLKDFPEVEWIALKENVGFGKACNVGARNAHGRYVLFLNPDTMVSDNTLEACVNFMEQHPQAGIMGPKVLNADGTLQVSCHRSFPTPLVTFYHMIGLSRLFPKSRRFGRYNLTYLDPAETVQVDAVSGAFIFMPLQLFWDIEGFDERFFMYGEDLDLCARVREKGLEVWYHPGADVIHFKGRSSCKHSLRARAAFYQAMILFSRKYQRTRGAYFPAAIVFAGIVLQAAADMGARLLTTFTAVFIDLFVVNVVLWAGVSLRFVLTGSSAPYIAANAVVMMGMHCLISVCYVWVLAYRGIYTKSRYSVANAFQSGLIAAMVFMACVFFLRQIAFSRISVGIASIVIAGLLVAWRELLPRATAQVRRRVTSTGRVILLGNGDVAASLIKNTELDKSARIEGVIWPTTTGLPGQFKGYAVLGHLGQAPEILARHRVDLLLVATSEPWYSYVIKALSEGPHRNLTIRWVPLEVLSQPREKLPQVIPLHDFRV